MKKTLSIVLALCLAVSMLASFALIADPAADAAPFTLNGIKVTDAAGYANPYLAVDSATAFVENQAAYVVVTFNLKDADTGIALLSSSDYVTSVTSTSLDLSYAVSTVKMQKITGAGVINAAGAVAAPFAATPVSYADGTLKITAATAGLAVDQATLADDEVYKYFITFVAVTKPAVAGDVKASLKVDEVKFVDGATNSTLFVYADGVLKYTIKSLGLVEGNNYEVYAGEEKAANYLFTYMQDGTKFLGIGYGIDAPVAVPFTYDGKLMVTSLDPDKDITASVNDANAFFGFTFQYNNAAKDKNFEAKTTGNPVVVTDTYAYVTAVVSEGDGNVDIAPTGDFSANIIVVLAASAVLAAAALAFVAKKARD